MDLKEDIKYNIFNYATKELSLDAFIAWLLYHYNDDKHKLYPIVKQLLNEIIKKSNIIKLDLPTNKIQIELQEEKRDITIYFLNEDRKTNNDLVIFFENKVNSTEGDGQIIRYHNKLKVKNEKFKHIIPVYFKSSYMTKKEDASLNMIKNQIESLVIFSQKDIAKFFIPLQTDNVLLNDWIKYFKYMEVSDIEVNEIKNISKKLKEKDNPNYKKSLKIKILDEIGNSIKTSKNLSKLEDYDVGPYNNSHAIYCWIGLPNKKTYFQIYILGEQLVRLSFNQNPADDFDEIGNKIELFCNIPNNWKYARSKNKRASFDFNLNIKSLDCSYKELEEQIKSAIIEIDKNTDLM